jgi:hypothetical protein
MEESLYTVDGLDKVITLDDLPRPDAGSPFPIVFSDDQNLLLSYDISLHVEGRVVLRFNRAHAHYFGAPNDEALHGHPLYSRGLRCYGIFEVLESSWKRCLEKVNRVHRQHDPDSFNSIRHFIITFHDKTFECLANGVAIAVRLPDGPDDARSLLLQFADQIRRPSD